MKLLLKRIILVLFIGFVGNSKFICECYGGFDKDREMWTKNSFGKCVTGVFNEVNDQELSTVINNIHQNRQGEKGTHIAVAEIVLYYSDDEQDNRPLRYVFTSGTEKTAAKQKLMRWSKSPDGKSAFTREMFDKYFRQMTGIKYDDRLYSVSSPEAFAHSERVIGVCILRSDEDYFIKNMWEKPPRDFAIFIKNSSPVCANCKKFFKGECCIDDNNRMSKYEDGNHKCLLVNKVIKAVKGDNSQIENSSMNIAKILKKCFNNTQFHVIISDDNSCSRGYVYLDDESDDVKTISYNAVCD